MVLFFYLEFRATSRKPSHCILMAWWIFLMTLGFFILSGNNVNTQAQKSRLQPTVKPLKRVNVDGLSQGSRTSGSYVVGSSCDGIQDVGLKVSAGNVQATIKTQLPSSNCHSNTGQIGSVVDCASHARPSVSSAENYNQLRSLGCCGDGHIPVNMQGVRKGCVYCQLTKSKTRSGYWVYTRYRCGECEVPLCMPTAERDCFQLYHKYLKDGSLQPPKLFPDSSSVRNQVEMDRSQRPTLVPFSPIHDDSSTILNTRRDQSAMNLFPHFPWQQPIFPGSQMRHTASPTEQKDEKSEMYLLKDDSTK